MEKKLRIFYFKETDSMEIISMASLTKKPVEIPVSILAAPKPVSNITATVG